MLTFAGLTLQEISHTHKDNELVKALVAEIVKLREIVGRKDKLAEAIKSVTEEVKAFTPEEFENSMRNVRRATKKLTLLYRSELQTQVGTWQISHMIPHPENHECGLWRCAICGFLAPKDFVYEEKEDYE